jgi:hypothetical protein
MMAVEGIGSLVQILANQVREQTANSQAGANTPATGNADILAATEDTFTPSAQNNFAQATAQDAGIFQVSQGALTAVTASNLFAQTNPNAIQSAASARPASSLAASIGGTQPSTPQRVDLPAIPGQLFGPSPLGQVSPAKAAPAATNEQAQIVALNAGLPALGLSKVEIQEIDRLASQIQNFNPATYTDLVNEFEALAQRATQQGVPNPAANASLIGNQSSTGNAKTNSSGSQN